MVKSYLHLVEISLFIIAIITFIMDNAITRIIGGFVSSRNTINELQNTVGSQNAEIADLRNSVNNLQMAHGNLESNFSNVLAQLQSLSAPAPESNDAEIERLLAEAGL